MGLGEIVIREAWEQMVKRMIPGADGAPHFRDQGPVGIVDGVEELVLKRHGLAFAIPSVGAEGSKSVERSDANACQISE